MKTLTYRFLTTDSSKVYGLNRNRKESDPIYLPRLSGAYIGGTMGIVGTTEIMCLIESIRLRILRDLGLDPHTDKERDFTVKFFNIKVDGYEDVVRCDQDFDVEVNVIPGDRNGEVHTLNITFIIKPANNGGTTSFHASLFAKFHNGSSEIPLPPEFAEPFLETEV